MQMTIMKYRSPMTGYAPVDRLAREIFGPSIARSFGMDAPMDHAPRVNITETADMFNVEALVPGFSKEDLKVELNGDTLTISGTHTATETKEELRWNRREFARTGFERSFILPKTVQVDAIQASHVNGVLTLLIPKAEESKPKARAIKIG